MSAARRGTGRNISAGRTWAVDLPAMRDRRSRLSPADADVAIVVADGLSATAIATNLLPLLDRLLPGLLAAKLSLGPIVLVEQGRVAVGDEIGEIVGAKLVVLLVGERPGLSAADSLSCYVTWDPRVGTMDSARHCISNIRSAGLSVADAAEQIVRLVSNAFFYRATGIRLNELQAAGMPVGASTATFPT